MKGIGRLTWRREPNETGLARICQRPRGALLRWTRPDGTKQEIARVAPSRRGTFGPYEGWFWYGGFGPVVPRRNTVEEGIRFDTLDEAKADCEAYVRKHLASVTSAVAPGPSDRESRREAALERYRNGESLSPEEFKAKHGDGGQS